MLIFCVSPGSGIINRTSQDRRGKDRPRTRRKYVLCGEDIVSWKPTGIRPRSNTVDNFGQEGTTFLRKVSSRSKMLET